MKGIFSLKVIKLIKVAVQIVGLIIINKLGFYLVEYFNLSLPGNVAGLVILFLLLWAKVIRLEWIEEASDLLVKHLSFFFVSISVGLMTVGGLLAKNGLQLAAVLITSAVIGMAFAGFAAQILERRKEETEAEDVYNDF